MEGPPTSPIRRMWIFLLLKTMDSLIKLLLNISCILFGKSVFSSSLSCFSYSLLGISSTFPTRLIDISSSPTLEGSGDRSAAGKSPFWEDQQYCCIRLCPVFVSQQRQFCSGTVSIDGITALVWLLWKVVTEILHVRICSMVFCNTYPPPLILFF